MLCKLDGIFLNFQFIFANTDCSIFLSECGKKNIYAGIGEKHWQHGYRTANSRNIKRSEDFIGRS